MKGCQGKRLQTSGEGAYILLTVRRPTFWPRHISFQGISLQFPKRAQRLGDLQGTSKFSDATESQARTEVRSPEALDMVFRSHYQPTDFESRYHTLAELKSHRWSVLLNVLRKD